MSAAFFDDLALEFRYLNDILRAGGTPADARQRLVKLACSALPECHAAGITARPDDAPARSLAYEGEDAIELDRLQHELTEGPCLEAARHDGPVRSLDLSMETRWPSFCEAAVRQSPVRGVLSFHITDHPVPTALNLYTRRPGAFGDEALSLGALFATHASVLMAHADSSHRAATLKTALITSRQIGAAVGILMAAHRMTEPEAFDLLRRTSNHLNRKLRDLAEEVTQTGELPDRR